MSRLSRAIQRLIPALVSASPYLGLLAVCLTFFWKLAFTNLILARGDMFLYFYPNWNYAADAVRHGHLPLWNPYLFMGVPFFANSQTGVLYPLNLALAWLPTTRAINLTIILHIWLAGAGAYIFARRSLGLSRWAAWLGAVTLALGGYLSAQVEHVNQLQALSWLPFLFTFFDLALERWRWGLALAAVVAIQFLAGHSQSVFISLIGLGAYALWPVIEDAAVRTWSARRPASQPGHSERSKRGASVSRKTESFRRLAAQGDSFHIMPNLARRLVVWIGAAMLGAMLSAAQLVPTLELARQSMRAGGLTWREAVSFSLSPALLVQALLPDFRQTILSEYVAYIGVVGLVLMAVGIKSQISNLKSQTSNQRISKQAMSVLVVLGLLLALGGYNPLYSLLIKFAPGFNLFRVPARWLVLYAFGAAMLVGTGVEQISSWWRAHLKFGLWYLKFGLTALLVVELFFASRPLGYNRPTAPDALTSLRPSVAHLLAASAGQPPSRFLSISPIEFDPGDKAELESIFADQLPKDAFYDLLIATKQKEIIGPNLSLYYRLSAADGYDGGVLPLRNYVTLEALFVPPDKVSPDGRLRENLRDVPDGKWLSMMNVRYVITDKTLDAWLDDVFYDLQFTTPLGEAGQREAVVAYVPRFEATALGVVSYLQGAASLPDGMPVAKATIGFTDGLTQTFTLRAGVDTAEGIYTGTVQHRAARVGGHFVRDHPEFNDYVTRLRFDGPRVVTSVAVRPLVTSGQIVVRGASLIDERTGGFQSLVISGRGRFRLIHSGDVKVYENLDALPRAFMVPQAVSVPNDAAALAAMNVASFDPTERVVLNGAQNVGQVGNLPYKADIVSHEPERVVVETDGESAGWLVLTDAWYSGWRATVDGVPVEVARADVLFRAVPVPAGRHRVEFVYAPASLPVGVGISVMALVVCLAAGASNMPRASSVRAR
jgi:hypothetical protein